MAQQNSFDIVSEVDRAEINNAINQTIKEVRQRFDFKGSSAIGGYSANAYDCVGGGLNNSCSGDSMQLVTAWLDTVPILRQCVVVSSVSTGGPVHRESDTTRSSDRSANLTSGDVLIARWCHALAIAILLAVLAQAVLAGQLEVGPRPRRPSSQDA